MSEIVAGLLAQPSLQALASDRRFAAVIDAIRAEAAPPTVETLVDARGIVVGRVERNPGGVRITLDERAAPGLGAFVARELVVLVGRYSAGER
jgi:hypothetical protein